MMRSAVYLAAEDAPGLAVGHKLIQEAPGLSVYDEYNAGGWSNLMKKARNYNEMGRRGMPVLLLADLDHTACPSQKIADWLEGKSPSQGFLLRLCVREVEAWLLAHREAIANFLGVGVSRIPQEPELLRDPKSKLIEAALRSKFRRIRQGFKPMGSATIGPEYNRLLCAFVRESWDVDVAAKTAPSLQRARLSIRRLADTI